VHRPMLEAGHALRVASALAERLDHSGWHGADPYDGLASPFARCIPEGMPRLRRAFLQCVRRSPIDLRPILRIGHRRMAAATGLASTASARLASDPQWRARRDRLARMTIERQMLEGRFRGLWGYEFDVQTRWGSYGATDPNIVATSFAADGCLDATALDDERTAWLAWGLLGNLWRADRDYFAYCPGTSTLIHNANLLGARLAARLAASRALDRRLRGDLLRAVRSAVATALRYQRDDGSWPYGEGRALGWVDGYHTAYILLSLDAIYSLGGVDDTARRALDRGARFYFIRMFHGSRPRHYAGHRVEPSDSNNVATGLRAAVWGAEKGYVPPAFPARVFTFLMTRFWDPEQYFRTSASRLGPAARLNCPRWAAAPALDALTALVAHARDPSGAEAAVAR
jgi:hypothetical protein